MVYMPTIRAITVNMSKLAGMTAARWYDPTGGKYAEVKGSPFANEGGRQFVPSGANNSGDGDWVLVLEAAPAR
jgi:Putative collagen-binding domain of a collagenase